MVSLRIYFEDNQAGAKFTRSVNRQRDRVRVAARQAAEDARIEIIAQGRADIATAGNFGSRWILGLDGTISEGGGNVRIAISHREPFFMIHERGGLITGRPLLWIPLSYTGIKNLWARDFPGRLFRVDRKAGPPVLVADDGKAKYVGLRSVTIRKKFHVEEIAIQIASKLKDFYKTRFAQAGSRG